MSNLRLEPHSGAGVEVLGIDLKNLTDNEFQAIQQAYADYGLVFFRDQSLSEQQHIELAERFGSININRFFAANESFPQIAMVTKEANQEVNIGGGWHTDHSYDHEPAMGSILVARDLPDSGGDTWFVSMYNALDDLSEGLRETLHGMKAVHSARHVFGSGNGYEAATGGRIGNNDKADVLEDPIHPVIIKHPLSGKEALYANPGFTRHFLGWSIEESEPLLNMLYEKAANPERICKFSWKPGSIAFWDNRATWHFAQNDYHGQRREMHRITLDGCALKAA
jgi:taurine dioxygenase